MTWTLVAIYCFACPIGNTIVVPNFDSPAACQNYGRELFKQFPLLKSGYIECIPSNYGE